MAQALNFAARLTGVGRPVVRANASAPLTSPGPSIATNAKARIRRGIDITTSVKRISIRSSHPP